MPVAVTSSVDGSTWQTPTLIQYGFSDYGLQLTWYRGELWGLMAQAGEPRGKLWINKYSHITWQWSSFTLVSNDARSIGRASIATLNDNLYVCWTDLNNNIYLRWTDKVETNGQWKQATLASNGNTIAAPAIHAYDGKLYVAGLGKDGVVQYGVFNADGIKVKEWFRYETLKSDYSPALVVYDGEIFIYSTEKGGARLKFQKLDKLPVGGGGGGGGDGGKKPPNDGDHDHEYQSVQSIHPAAGTVVQSGPSLTVWSGNNNLLVAAYRCADNYIRYQWFNKTTNTWNGEYVVGTCQSSYEFGIETWGSKITVAVSLIPGTYAAPKTVRGSSSRLQIQTPGATPEDAVLSTQTMNEKVELPVGGIDDEEWDCKWKEGEEDDSSWVKNWFCM